MYCKQEKHHQGKRDGWLYPEGRSEAVRVQLARENPTLAILGAQFVCSDSVIGICSSSKFISVVSDMDAFCLCVNPFSVGSRNTGVLLFSFSSVHLVSYFLDVRFGILNRVL